MSGPITLFDKSFLQSLSVDESAWFDIFFIANVCPLFFVETLADLEKSSLGKRSPEQEVRVIADKFPEMQGSPNAYHGELAIANLLGQPIAMTGQIHLAGGRLVKVGNSANSIYEPSPEAEAFRRWQECEFLEVERQYARTWRKKLSTLDLMEAAKAITTRWMDDQSCRTLEDAAISAQNLLCAPNRQADCIRLAFLFLDIPQQYQGQILELWKRANFPPLYRFAAYAAYVLSVELFFQVALANSLISTERPSNRVDIACLFYLPFCTIFVSSDRLHQKCAPLFLRNDQQFVCGDDFKKGCKELNEFYSRLPQETKDQGLMSFAVDPPKQAQFLVTQLWDRHLPGWRERQEFSQEDRAMIESYVKEKMSKMVNAGPLDETEIAVSRENTDSILLKRMIKRKRGSWWQVDKNLTFPRINK
ncbi:MAG: hypothetical protein ACLP5H_31890 [Desulfomonilaceae bacterium]